jgi:RNA polymerase primary sigma factor
MVTKTIIDTAQNDALQAYYAAIRRHPLLDGDQEKALSRRVLAGDNSARQKLIESNLRLVVKIAKAYEVPDVPLLDLIQEGNLGLIKAAGRFDFRKDVRFSTYAAWWIKQSISRALANRRRAIRIPHRKEDALKNIQRAYNFLSQKLMRSPTVEEIAQEVHLSPMEVNEIMQITSPLVSLETEINEENGTLMDLIEDETYSPDRMVMEEALHDETERLLHMLKERERQVMMYRYASAGGKRYTLKWISDTMGVSPETVRQIELRALRKLRSAANDLRELVVS